MEWKNKIINIKESQLDFYKRNNACREVLKLVGLESKAFGMFIERIIREMFSMNKPLNSQHDAIFNDKKIEIKSSRFWGGTMDCKWQHVEPTYDYDYILFVLVEFQDLRIWGMHKSKVKKMIEQGILTPQGKQGYWCKMSSILPHLTLMMSLDSLIQNIKEHIDVIL
jgi:hypothetical protein